ncbi:MAG: hypothetical protein H6587_12750 [Flavobacteriales bacterium]|nr:hypothetical protein [Flavobacteriales bacterium]MCB9365433.1 hypothetical protein [Flavobacteriales bacterium]
MKNLKQYIFTLLFLIAISFVNNAFAAGPPGAPTRGGGGPPCWPPPCVPIDGGISFLLFAGALYGSKKVYDISKKAE